MARRADTVAGNGATSRPRKAGAPAGGVSPTGGEPLPSAFDLWLDRGLHQLFDTVAHEPVPEALLKIIEEGQGKK